MLFQGKVESKSRCQELISVIQVRENELSSRREKKDNRFYVVWKSKLLRFTDGLVMKGEKREESRRLEVFTTKHCFVEFYWDGEDWRRKEEII